MAEGRNEYCPLKSWTTEWHEADDSAHVQWNSRDDKRATADEYPPEEGSMEYNILHKWSSGIFDILATDRTLFAGVDAQAAVRELVDMAEFLRTHMKFEDKRLSEGV